jgi:hypothetical protein
MQFPLVADGNLAARCGAPRFIFTGALCKLQTAEGMGNSPSQLPASAECSPRKHRIQMQ